MTVQREGPRAPGSGPGDLSTRKKPAFWDRGMFLIGLSVAFLVLTWKMMADYEGVATFADSARTIARDHQWIFWLLGVEALRQSHFLVSERSPGYHGFWSRRVFGGFERWAHRRFDDRTRFRLSRLVKILFWVALLALVLGAALGTSPFLALFRAPALIFQALPSLVRILFPFFVIVIPFAGLFWLLSRGGVETYFPGDIKTRFADVWGQDHVLERLREHIVFLERPGEIERRGGYVPTGLLLWGPPGTGKTLMAEAVAGETGKPYVYVAPGAFAGLFMGIGFLKVKALFRKLRKLALRHGGVIVFFDEADSLGRRGRPAQRGPQGQGGGFSGCHGLTYLSEEARSLIAFRARRPADEPGTRNRFFMGDGDPGALRALLTELSGLSKPRGFFNRLVRRLLGMRPKPPPKCRILVVMATDRPGALDEALLRPGRIDRVYKVGHPSKTGRSRTYQGYFGKVGHELTEAQIDKLSTITPYATGATIKDLVNESLINAIRDGREIITWSDVLRAERLKRLGPPEDVEYVERERHAVAVHEACHAVIAHVTRPHLEIDIATIEKGSGHLGLVAPIQPEARLTRWKSEYEADIMVSLASLAGERMFFGEDNSSGVSGDLYSATFLTALMEAHWGMGSGVTSLPALRELEIMDGRAVPGRGRLDLAPDMLGERIEDNLVRLLEKTGRLLEEHRREVLCVAHALETHRTVNGDDVVAIIERGRGPVVDGRTYASDAFYQELEDYHRKASRAHQEHGRIERELPAPGPAPRSPARRPAAVPAAEPPSSAAGFGVGPPAVSEPAGVGGEPEARWERPGFVPWAPDARARPLPATPYVTGPPAPARRAHGQVWVVVVSLAGLVAVALIGALALTGVSLPPGTARAAGLASPALLLILFVVVIAVIVGGALALVAVKGVRAAQAKAERERDQAHARAQLLAAAMEPGTAMRLLGYHGNDGHEGYDGNVTGNGTDRRT